MFLYFEIIIMYNRSIKVDKIAALCGMIWYVFIIDACFTWFFSWNVRYFLGAPFVFYATLLLSQDQGIIVDKQRRTLFISLFILMLFGVICKYEILVSPFRYAPLMCIVFWRPSALIKTYEYFKKFILFYAVVSIIVEVLVLTNTWTLLPYIIIPPVDNVQEELGIVNYFFGFYSVPATGTSLDFYRACGPGREGGHFSLYLGFLYFSEIAIFNKRHIILLICGILTLSPNFLICLIIAEGYCIIKGRGILKPLLIVSSFVLTVIFAFIIAPSNVQDEIISKVLEKSIEHSLDNMETDGIMAFIDDRTGVAGLQNYASFQKRDLYTRLVGLVEMPKDNVMSDYRYMIMQRGYIGMILTIVCIIFFSVKIEKNMFGICLLLIELLILLHRSWMFFQVYWWTTLLLIIAVKHDEMTIDQSHVSDMKQDVVPSMTS